MRNRSLRRMLLDAWRQERSMDPEQDTTLDLLAGNRPVAGEKIQGGVLFRVHAAFLPPGIQQHPA